MMAASCAGGTAMDQNRSEISIQEWDRRYAWRLRARAYGFQGEVADRLAFWRWVAEQRRETGQRTGLVGAAAAEWTLGSRTER
jgi:hypothetical protein